MLTEFGGDRMNRLGEVSNSRACVFPDPVQGGTVEPPSHARFPFEGTHTVDDDALGNAFSVTAGLFELHQRCEDRSVSLVSLRHLVTCDGVTRKLQREAGKLCVKFAQCQTELALPAARSHVRLNFLSSHRPAPMLPFLTRKPTLWFLPPGAGA
ncbi:hypothetical protein DPX16_8992 [Anabarilius grahami]|uniref:Uncharacterized protein n=1 Tax=Anabarilius grahami TaxID=495550 RepID=A0A3N0XCY0_ANAGA|nr:hypothetical protein DPX16_8992 [Anabarilius grahami]